MPLLVLAVQRGTRAREAARGGLYAAARARARHYYLQYNTTAVDIDTNY